jgi:hypothetical protein
MQGAQGSADLAMLGKPIGTPSISSATERMLQRFLMSFSPVSKINGCKKHDDTATYGTLTSHKVPSTGWRADY